MANSVLNCSIEVRSITCYANQNFKSNNNTYFAALDLFLISKKTDYLKESYHMSVNLADSDIAFVLLNFKLCLRTDEG